MRRRDILRAAPAAVTLAPALAFAQGAPRAKITGVKVHQLRVVQEFGQPPGAPRGAFVGRRGGGGFTEYQTDAGVTGIGPMLDPNSLKVAQEYLVGKSPFALATLVANLPRPGAGPGGGAAGFSQRGAASAEIGLWDLYGKLVDQPLYKLWGGKTNQIIPYASFVTRGASPEERADVVKVVRSQGWRAIKMRPHWETIKQDIRMAELARKAGGDDMVIMVDPNQADGRNPSGVTWDFKRAAETGKAYEELGVYWLEEPLHRANYDGLAELNRMFTMKVVGGESNTAMSDFRDYVGHRCYDMLQPEIMTVGPTELMRIATMARFFDVDVVPHSGFGNMGTFAQLHFVAASGAPYGEWHHDPPTNDYQNDMFIFEDAPQVKDGYLAMPDKPGLGLSIKRDLIQS